MGKGNVEKNCSSGEAIPQKSQTFGKVGNNESAQGKGRSKGTGITSGHLTSPRDDAFGTGTRSFTAKGRID